MTTPSRTVTCPLCGEPASELHVQIEQVTIGLIARDHPGWVREDGSCPACLALYEQEAAGVVVEDDEEPNDPGA